MYYILNIKANNSEFILESAERPIIEKEMDAYFACFFNASTEFKSKIKKVELRNDNLISIKDIETKKITDNKKNSVNDTFIEASIPLNVNDTKEQVIDYEKTLNFLDDDNSIEDLDQQSRDSIAKLMNFQEDDTLVDTKQPIALPETTNEAIEISQSPAVTTEASNEELEFKEEKEPQEIDETNSCNIAFPEEGLIFEDDGENITAEELAAKTSCETAVILDKIFEKQPKEDGFLIQKEEPVIEIEKPADNTINKDANLDFKLFLASYLIFDLSNQFIACAFYIKNILKQDNFTLKEINAKLIKAVGTIANMSIVSELCEKNYIDFKEENSIKKYSITSIGEEYFTGKYQG